MRIRMAIPVPCAPRSTKVSCAGSNWLRDAGLLGQLPVKELIGDLYFCIKLIQRIITNTQNKIKTNSVGVTRQRSNSSTKHVGRRSKAGSTDPQQLARKLSMDMAFAWNGPRAGFGWHVCSASYWKILLKTSTLSSGFHKVCVRGWSLSYYRDIVLLMRHWTNSLCLSIDNIPLNILM
jgi:hypothetical protein